MIYTYGKSLSKKTLNNPQSLCGKHFKQYAVKDLGAEKVWVWPSAELAVMRVESAAK